jgi:phenylalanyl-tRNA synthetase beta chain
MYLSFNWLKTLVNIPGSVSPEDLGARLLTHTVEVDDIIHEAEKYKDIVVGKLLTVDKHPNADKLLLAKVDIGEDKALEIVCGAPNIKAGQYVPVAMVGSVLPNGLEIKAAEIRGVKSNGMLCAEDELNLGEDHSGILILEKKGKPGQALGEYLGLKDVIFEIDNKSITNRPDLWGHYGMAREIATFLETKVKTKFEDKTIEKIKTEGENITKVKIDDYKLCPRYIAATITGVKIEESPKWIQERLSAVGVRPINNIVDITNYVMLETGQPLHAFDQARVNEIIVRAARDKELCVTLDGEERELTKNDIVIADKSKAIAIAGVMGGENSEINDQTTSVVIESANFNPVAVRKTSQRLSLRTEASKRFEKSLDPNLCEQAVVRTIELIKEVCSDSRVADPIIDEKKFKLDEGPIGFNIEWLNKFIGEELDESKLTNILKRLGFKVELDSGNFSVIVPSWRATKDISIKEDIAEEVARLIGYDNIKLSMPLVDMKRPEEQIERKFINRLKDIAAQSLNLNEVLNYSFVGEDLLKNLGQENMNHIAIKNPISSELTHLRQNLAPNLITNVKTNQPRFDNFTLFEIGSVYLPHEGEIVKDEESQEYLPYQEKRLGIVIANKNRNEAFSDAKGIVAQLLRKLNIEVRFENIDTPLEWADSNYSIEIKDKEDKLGTLYLVSQSASKRLNLKRKVVVAELIIKELINAQARAGETEYREYAKYPPVIRDLAFVVKESIAYNDIKDAILDYNELVVEAELFDVYRGEQLKSQEKNLAFHIVYQAERTLKGEEVDRLQAGLIGELEEKFEAKIRNF